MHSHTVAVDWDGTLVENEWPGIGEWKPGAVKAMQTLHKAGIHLAVFTARIAPVDPWGMPRDQALVLEEIQRIRERLDKAGLTFVQIHTNPWKIGASVYVDDKAERYTGRPGSWAKLVPKLLVRCGKATSDYPPLEAGA